MQLDWPEPDDGDKRFLWDPSPMAPVRATATLALAVRPTDPKSKEEWLIKRRDRWQSTLLSENRGHILHDVEAQIIDRPDQQERREVLRDGERLATRAGGAMFLLRPTTAPWKGWLRRPRREFEQLLESVGCEKLQPAGVVEDGQGRAAQRYEGTGPLGKATLLVDPTRRVVLSASAELRDSRRSARFEYSLGTKDATLTIPEFSAQGPERPRPLRERQQLLKGLTK